MQNNYNKDDEKRIAQIDKQPLQIYTQYKSILWAIILLFVMFVSIFLIANNVSSPENYLEEIAILDEKKMTALGLTASLTGAAALITLIPGDFGTSIANQLSDLTTPLLIVVCVIYLMKYLLPIAGYISFTWLIPIACALGLFYVFTKKEWSKVWGMKLAAFALILSLMIPASVKIVTMVETTFEESITETMNKSEQMEDKVNQDEDSSFWQSITNSGEKAKEKAKTMLNVFVDSVAVLVITTCIIPILVLLGFLKLIKVIFGMEFNTEQLKDAITMKKKNK